MKKDDVIAEILRGRGISTPEEVDRFLNPRYEDTHDPLLLADMDQAIARVKRAIAEGESIVVYGDYDIDGLSATALLLDGLRAMGGQVEAYIPDRFEEGYGINTEALRKLKGAGADLVITVDCGSTSHAPLQWAKDNQLDVIVTDHHTVKETLPPAVAIINPKRTDNAYPFTDLAGVGVAFKLVQGLSQEGLLPPGREKWLLDLVALGTVCDVVGLVDENRILVTYGLKVFAKTTRVGLRALMLVAEVDRREIDTHHFGFVLGPRLNAAGRLEHARLALDLFTATDKAEAWAIAEKLENLNRERRQQQDKIMEMAVEQAQERPQDNVLVLSDPSWNHGIVGIVAAKIMERFSKPTIILQELGEESKGSARSLGDFSIVSAMKSAEDLLLKYGGHHVAAGCSLKTEDIPQLRARLNAYFDAEGYGDLRSRPRTDVEVGSLSDMSYELLEELSCLAPFGMGNPRPQFKMSEADVSGYRLVGADKRHVKLRLADTEAELDGIGFGLADEVASASEAADIWFELEENQYQGRRSLQARIKAIE